MSEETVGERVNVKFPVGIAVKDLESLERRLDELRSQGNSKVSLDLSELDTIDSAGLWVMIELQHYAAEKGMPLTYHGQKRNVDQILRLMGLDVIYTPQSSPC